MRRLPAPPPRRALPLAVAATLAALLLALARPPSALAGGSAETTLVVVNGESPVSWRVANAYVRARGIPSTHVCVLRGVPSLGVVPVDVFRERLLGPVEAYLETHGLADAVDCVAWSADFPYGVDFEADQPAKGLQVPWTPVASLSGLTFLGRHVLAKDAKAYLRPGVNGYYRRAGEEAGPSRELTDEESSLRNDAQAATIEKRWADAVAAYEKLLATLPSDIESLYHYACALARLRRLDDAVAALARAVGAGYTDAGHTEEDADLEPLRGRDDYRALVARMRAAGSAGVQPSHGFRARWAWTGAADPVVAPAADSRDRYRLSTHLAYTGEWGNSVPEAIASLEAAAKADGTDPDGTFYFLVNGDVRAKTREPRFDRAIEALRAMGRKAVLLRAGEDGQDGILPKNKADVLGAVLGTAGFDWSTCGSRILPGAICEHLTSHGAEFRHGGQTKLSALIRAGAAGASGTVHEPYAVQWKFPVPHIHVHYAAGCSLAEAFYESVAGPYQLMVVGDPLARPFAKFAKVALPAPTAPWTGKVSVAATVEPAAGRPLATVELWVDGVPVAEGKPGETFAFDSTTVEDGAHEVRVVAVEADPVGTRSAATATVTVANGTAATTLVAPKAAVALDATVALSGKAPGASEVQVLAGHRVLATVPVKGDAWKAGVPASELGLGTTTLQARAVRGNGGFRGPFVDVTVAPPAPRKHATPLGKGTPGLRCELVGADGKVAATLVLPHLGGFGAKGTVREAIAAKGAGPWKEIRVAGELDVGAAGLYELVVNVRGDLALEVDGRPLLALKGAAPEEQRYALAAFEAGWHDLSLRWTPAGAPDLTVLLSGDRVATPLEGRSLRHAADGDGADKPPPPSKPPAKPTKPPKPTKPGK